MNNKWKWLSIALVSYILIFGTNMFKWFMISLIFLLFLLGNAGTIFGFLFFGVGIFVGIVVSRALIEWILNSTHKENNNNDNDLH